MKAEIKHEILRLLSIMEKGKIMAGTATHLAVADLICEKIGNDRFKNLSLFYCGNIAPDAIHARENYVRAFKKHTHLTDGMSGKDFQDPEKLSAFRERLSAYISRYCRAGDEEYDLYLGYAAHLVCDELFNIKIRKMFQETAQAEGINETDDAFRRIMMKDMDAVDGIIMNKYPFKNDVGCLLDASWGYEVRDMITAEEINNSKKWIMHKLFLVNEILSEPVYYSYEIATQFIENAAAEIISRLF